MKLEPYMEKTLDEYMKYVKETINTRYADEPLNQKTIDNTWNDLNWLLSKGKYKIIKDYSITWSTDSLTFCIYVEHINKDFKFKRWIMSEE